MQTILLNYQQTLQNIISNDNNLSGYNEHTFRTAFENLLNALKPHSDISIIHEPQAKGQGSIRPDFKVIRKAQGYDSLLGFIECKTYGADLTTLIKGKQIEKYLTVCHNIILTDYNRFILLSYGNVIDDFTLFDEIYSTPKEAKLIEISTRFSHLLQSFFDTLVSIKQKDELIKVLSIQSFYLSSVINEAKQSHADFSKTFENAFESFRNLENTAVSAIEFCDILSQSIVYGMFVAHIDSEDFEIDKIPTQSFSHLLPKHFATLTEFILHSLPPIDLPQSILYTLENIIKTIALIDKPSLAKSFQKEISEISIYLYEDFLREYDKLRNTNKKKSGGVYYTPKPIVDMIAHSINELLGRHFGKGFSDDGVKVLDFATGTGSFLAKVFEMILSAQSEVFTKETIINKCFRDIYGFEISFVPYIVAHLKLSAILRNRGFSDFSAEQKFQIFLTNTLDLDRARDTGHLLVPFRHLKNERDKAITIKHKDDLLVILGNPPYNVKSKNKGAEILKLLQSYKQGLNETNIQPLDDDYIKFIRFAQWKLTEQSQKRGVMGFITNNSYLDGRTHRKMRQSLAKTFDEIYILNLHGDSDKEDKEDKNVFDIRVGVCVSIFVKHKDSPKAKKQLAKVHYFSTKDNEILRRNDKFALLNSIAHNGLDSIKWVELELNEPYFWFVPKTFDSEEYEHFWALASDKALGESRAIFEVCNCGTNSRKDSLLIQPSKTKIKEMLNDMQKLERESILQKYHLKETQDWTINDQRKNFKNPKEQDIIQIAYKPFDTQFIFYPLNKISKIIPRGDSRKKTMKHFLQGKNLGICFTKVCEQAEFDNAIISDKPADIHYNGGQTYISPLYRYDEITGDKEGEVSKISKIPNFTKEFSKFKAQNKVLKDKSPEQILAFIYGNLYNPTYRTKYLEYLKIGFPRVNFEVSESAFSAFEKLGQKLIDLHLMREIPHDTSIELKFRANANRDNPNFVLDTPEFADGKIMLNKDLEIIGVSAEVWDYTIGGYKVLDKWLKYRVGLRLEKEDFAHLVNIAKILKTTIAIQGQLAQI